MLEQPTLTTDRLCLRPFRAEDADAVHNLVGDRLIAATTMSIPHPYEEGMADAWIASRTERYELEEGVVFAITRRLDGTLLGSMGMHLNLAHSNAELGYWIGVPFWNQGICTEAARAILAYGFENVGLHRITARHLARNPASGRVMQKLGMTREGEQREHVLKWGVFEDVVCYGILKSEYTPLNGG